MTDDFFLLIQGEEAIEMFRIWESYGFSQLDLKILVENFKPDMFYEAITWVKSGKTEKEYLQMLLTKFKGND